MLLASLRVLHPLLDVCPYLLALLFHGSSAITLALLSVDKHVKRVFGWINCLHLIAAFLVTAAFSRRPFALLRVSKENLLLLVLLCFMLFQFGADARPLPVSANFISRIRGNSTEAYSVVGNTQTLHMIRLCGLIPRAKLSSLYCGTLEIHYCSN